MVPGIFDPNLDKAVVAKYLEHEINEQAKTLEDLQKLGASDATVNAEMKKLNEKGGLALKVEDASEVCRAMPANASRGLSRALHPPRWARWRRGTSCGSRT